MPNNNTALFIYKINLSFISFLWVEQWSGGADVDSTHAFSCSIADSLTEVCVCSTAARSRQDSWASLAEKIRPLEKKLGHKPATPQTM
jgi:hypothetical protein